MRWIGWMGLLAGAAASDDLGDHPEFAHAMQVETRQVDGQAVENPLNQEVATIRGQVPGEYTVNIHYYDSENPAPPPVPVSVRVAKVNPVYTVVFNETVELRRKGEEYTALRFTILRDGAVGRIHRLEKKLVQQ